MEAYSEKQSELLFTGIDEQIGMVFGIKVGSNWVRGKFTGRKVTEPFHRFGSIDPSVRRSKTRYHFVNLQTGREVVLKSRVKIAGRIREDEGK